MNIDRKKIDCTALPKGWPKDDLLRKSGISAGKADIYYYGPAGKRNDSKVHMARHLGDSALDISTSDFQTGKYLQNSRQITMQRTANTLKRKLPAGTIALCNPSSSISSPSKLHHHVEFSRGIRPDISLVPPIRQTASIFKQPVTIQRNHQDGKVRHDLKHGPQEKPKQLFWEKRLEGSRAYDVKGTEFEPIDLPRVIKPVGPNVHVQTVLQSVVTALHVSSQPITGQTASKTNLSANSGVFINPDQPLMQAITVTEDDIRRQEDRVNLARRRLQEALKG